MRRLVPLVLVLAVPLVAFAVLTPPPATAEEPHEPRGDILPLKDVRPGMRGVAHTVFAGTRIETFEVEIVDVIRHYRPKQDVILVRCLGERIARLGIAQGMSGSPVYVDGKIVGALAYTWAWALAPLAGVTPIEDMIAEGKRPFEKRASGAEPPTHLRTPRPVPLGTDADALEPIGTPVCIGGFSAVGRQSLVASLREAGLNARAAGGGLVAGAPEGWANLDAPVVPGAALTVDLVRGDFSVSVIGTCTYVDGDRVHAFGHDFENVGETLWPLSVGYVYTIVPSRNMSFKMGAPIREIGAVVQDRPSGIVGHLGRKASMVPFAVTLQNAVTRRSEDFKFEVCANRIYFQRMVIASLREAFSKAERTLGSNTKHYELTVKLKGVDEPWTYDDTIVGFDTGLSRLMVGLIDRVMNHPHQRAEFEWVKLDVEIQNVDRRATIENVTASKDEVHPGESLELLVRLRRHEGGDLLLERIPVRVPETARAGNLSIQVMGGDNVAAEMAAPVDILDVQPLYDAFYKATELVAVVPTGRLDLDVDGHFYRGLPLSTLPRIARSPSAVRARVHPNLHKVRRTVPYVVWGSDRVVVRVLP